MEESIMEYTQYQYTEQTSSQESAAKPRKNSYGQKGLILGIISIILLLPFYHPFMWFIVWIIPVLGLVKSIKGLSYSPKGFAIAGLILSATPFVFHFILWLTENQMV